MVKKSLIIILTLLLLLSFTACGGGSTSSSSDPGKHSKYSESLQTIMDSKGTMYSKLTENMPDEMAWASLDMLGVSLMDLNLAFVAACGTDGAKQGIEMAFSMFGLTDVNYKEDGTNYTVTAKTSENVEISYDIQYDKSSDSIKVKYLEGSTDEMYFESVRINGGYGFLYQSNSDGSNGKYYVVKGIVYDTGDGIFATGDLSAKLDSIYQNSSVFTNDFVKQGLVNTYEVKDGKCYTLYDGKNYEYQAGTGESDSDEE